MISVEEIKKLMGAGHKDSEKNKEKMLEVRRFYAEEHDWQTNYARLSYDVMFDFYCREAKKEKRDLWEYLFTEFMFSDVRHLINPPDTLKKKEQELWIKNQYMPYFYEFLINQTLLPIQYAFTKDFLPHRKAGENTVKITKQRSAARRAPLIKERKTLIDSGVTDERVILKRIRKAFPKELSHYIQQTIQAEKYKEADERRLQKPHALSP